MTQLIKNTLNSAHQRQSEYEKYIAKRKEYEESLEKVKEMLDSLRYEPERPTSLATVKTSIQRVDLQIKTVASKKGEFDALTSEGKALESTADTINRHKISDELIMCTQQWKNILSELKERKENLAALALQWEDFDSKYKVSFKLCFYNTKIIRMTI